jgi:hypothetical protein
MADSEFAAPADVDGLVSGIVKSAPGFAALAMGVACCAWGGCVDAGLTGTESAAAAGFAGAGRGGAADAVFWCGGGTMTGGACGCTATRGFAWEGAWAAWGGATGEGGTAEIIGW